MTLLLIGCSGADANDSTGSGGTGGEGGTERTPPRSGDIRLYLDASEVVDTFSVPGEGVTNTYRHQAFEHDLASGNTVKIGSDYESSSDFYFSSLPRTYGGRLFLVSENGTSDPFLSAIEQDLTTLDVLGQASAQSEGYAVVHGVSGADFFFSDARGLLRAPIGPPSNPNLPPPETPSVVVRGPQLPGQPDPCLPVGASGYCVITGATLDPGSGQSSDWYFELFSIDLQTGASSLLFRRDTGDREVSFVEGEGAVHWLEGLRNTAFNVFPAGDLELWRYDGQPRRVASVSLPLVDGSFPTYLVSSDADGGKVALLAQPGNRLFLIDVATGEVKTLDVAPPFGDWETVEVLEARP
jgi:hypothetical protein